MCGITCSVITIIVGAALVIGSCVLSFVFVPDIIKSLILGEIILKDDTIQMERFEEIPFPINFTVRIFNLSNPDEVVNGGVPVVKELGPYTYKLYQSRDIFDSDEETLSYRRLENFEFDPIASYPNTEEDLVTITNVAYHAITQVAESMFTSLLPILNLAMNGIFGQYNEPVMTIRVRDLLFDGIPLCKRPGALGGVACSIIKEIASTSRNIEEQEDGSLLFSVLNYKDKDPSLDYTVSRGLQNYEDVGRIMTYNNSQYFSHWVDDDEENPSVCNMVNGTDAGIFQPFVVKGNTLYAINTDICRSVELRYEKETVFEGLPTYRYAANEWFLDNDDGCFCLNVTGGINRDNGCLLRGAMELYTCVGAFLVLSYPHFLFADSRYQDGVVGMRPDEEIHKIFMDIEPITGTPVRGFKRAQFNVFMRPVSGIPPTQNLRTSLVPFLWVEEGIFLPEEYLDELLNRLIKNLELVDIILPILIAICCVVFVLGIGFTIRAKRKNPNAVLSNGVN